MQGFLTAVLQNHARLTEAPIDQIAFGFSVMSMEDKQQPAEAPEVGACVSGLHLEAARCEVLIQHILPAQMETAMPILVLMLPILV